MKSLSLVLLVAVGCLFMFHPQFTSALERREALSKEEAANMHRQKKEDDASDEPEPFIIAGYLPDYRDYININAAAMHLTDILIFSVTPKTIMQYAAAYEYSVEEEIPRKRRTPPPPGGCCLSQDHYDKIEEAKSYKRKHQRKRMRLLVTIGGGGRSDGFKGILIGGKSIQHKFIKGMLQLCMDQGLDGIDFNYEGMRTIADWKAYIEFLMIASEQLHDRDLLISVAVHPGQVMPSADVCDTFDRIHVMTYDMNSPPPEKKSANNKRGRRTNNNKRNNNESSDETCEDKPSSPSHASFDSAKEAIEEFIEKSCPPSKLIMGIPAYGRHEKDPGLVKTFSEIVDESVYYNSVSNKEVLKNIQSVNKWEGYQFDSPEDVRAKVQYAKRKGLGGVFFWELGQDKQLEGVANGGVLLKAAASAASE